MSDEVLVGAPVAQARERLLRQVRLDGLHAVVTGSFADEEKLAGAGTALALDRKLTVHSLPSYLSGAVTIVPLRWCTGSAFADRFPAVDANLELQRADAGTSRLGLTGIYRPPAGHSLTSKDKDEVRASIRRFLGRLATVLAVG